MKSIQKFILPALLIVVISSCRNINYLTDTDAKLTFSKDTVHFDTVFNGIGSATRFFIVYNQNDMPVKISDIQLAGGDGSNFRINVNGSASTEFSDVTVNGNDSIFVFADVNIDPQNDDVIEYDQIRFYTNGNEQIVHLLAYGQDIHLLNDSVIGTQTWTNEKPYVIYNSIAVDENQVLTIEAGTHIYSHRNSRFIVLGSIIVNGSFDNPVIFEGDRLNGNSSIFFENDSLDNYDDVAGQWEGIWLTKISKNNYINYAEIKNAVIGIQLDSTQNMNHQLTLLNSKVEHHSFAGIYTQISSVFAANCLISDCGYYAVAITRGGYYEFYHCTFANYWGGVRRNAAVYANNFYQVPNGPLYVYDLQNAYFGNCIVWGNGDTEIDFEGYTDDDVQFNYLFENSLLLIDEASDIDTDDELHFKNIQLNDPLFIDPYNFYNFNLSDNSPAINAGSPDIVNLYPSLLQYDLNNNSRTEDENPDIGAFEYQ